MTRPDWCDEQTWFLAGDVMGEVQLGGSDEQSTIARALLAAEQRGAERERAANADRLDWFADSFERLANKGGRKSVWNSTLAANFRAEARRHPQRRRIMTMPEGIPDWAWDKAQSLLFDFNCAWSPTDGSQAGRCIHEAKSAIASALMAERARCMKIIGAYADHPNEIVSFVSDEISRAIRNGGGE